MTKIRNSIPQLSRGLYGQILQQMNGRLQAGIPRIKQVIASNISFYLWQSDTVRELLNPSSRLVGVLGLDQASSRVDDVIQAVANSTKIDFNRFRMTTGSKVSGKFVIKIGDINEIEKLPSATIIGKHSQHNFITMLTSGDKVWSLEYSWLFKPEKSFKASRTDHSLIIESPNARAIRVPPEFAGNRKDNFLSRALNKQEFFDELEQVIFSIIGG